MRPPPGTEGAGAPTPGGGARAPPPPGGRFPGGTAPGARPGCGGAGIPSASARTQGRTNVKRAHVDVGRPAHLVLKRVDGSGTLGWTNAPGGGGGSMPIDRIRARCVAAWVLAQGKSGPDGKY